MAVRELGFKPYIAPALSSRAAFSPHFAGALELQLCIWAMTERALFWA